MTEIQEQTITLSELIAKTRLLIIFLIRSWWKLLLAAILGAALGFLVFTFQKPRYDAFCTFVLEEKQPGMGGLSGLASQFGIDIGSITGGGGGGMFTGDNIFEILNSQVILKEVLLSKIDSSRGNERLADRFLRISRLKEAWAKHPLLDTIDFAKINSPAQLNRIQDSVLNIVYDQIVKRHLTVERVSKKGTLIKTTVGSTDPDFSRFMVERLVAVSRSYYIHMKTSITTANIERLQGKSDSLLHLLSSRSYGAAAVQLNDPNPALKILAVPTELASRDKAVVATLYGEVMKNLEIAKTTQMMQTPVIQILDMPPLSLYDNKRGKMFWMAIAVLITGTVTAIFLVITRFKG